MQQRRSYEPLQATFVPFSLSLSLSLPSPSTHIGRLCLITFMQQQKAQQGLSAPTANFLKPFTDEGKAAVVLWSRGGELFPPVKTRPQTSHIHPYERRAQGMRQKWRRLLKVEGRKKVIKEIEIGEGIKREGNPRGIEREEEKGEMRVSEWCFESANGTEGEWEREGRSETERERERTRAREGEIDLRRRKLSALNVWTDSKPDKKKSFRALNVTATSSIMWTSFLQSGNRPGKVPNLNFDSLNN